MVLGHQQAQCWLKSYIGFLLNLVINDCAPPLWMSFIMVNAISCNLMAPWALSLFLSPCWFFLWIITHRQYSVTIILSINFQWWESCQSYHPKYHQHLSLGRDYIDLGRMVHYPPSQYQHTDITSPSTTIIYEKPSSAGTLWLVPCEI